MTASLSAVHLLGFTLLSGAAFVMHLRLMGAVLRRAAVPEIARTASALIAVGLVVSILTGSLLFAGRATSIAPSGIFQAKMALFGLAVLWQAAVQRRLAGATPLSPRAERGVGFAGLAIWLSLAVTACAFILLE